MDDSFEVEYARKTYTVMFFVSSGKWEFFGGRLARKMTECSITNLLDRKNTSFSLAGNAFCSSKDTYNKLTGYKLALTRALVQVPLTREFRTAVWRSFWEWRTRDALRNVLSVTLSADDSILKELIGQSEKVAREFGKLQRCAEVEKCKACACDNGICKKSDICYISTFRELRDGDFFLIKDGGLLFRKEGVDTAKLVGHNTGVRVHPEQVVIKQ